MQGMMDSAARMAAAETRERELERLGDEIAELSAHIDAATWRLLTLIREFDEREGWGNGFQSCAHWLSWRVGLGLVAAREKVRVVRALTRIASPAIEEELLGIARAGTATHVETLVRGYRLADRSGEDARAERQHEGRYLRTWTDEHGMFAIEGRLSPEVGAAVAKAIEAAVAALREDERERGGKASDLARGPVPVASSGQIDASAESPDTLEPSPGPEAPIAAVIPVSPSQRRADALGFIAEAALAANLDRGPGAERAMVVLHVDADVLADPDLDGRSELEEGAAIPPDTARRVACDAAVVKVTHGADGGVLDVGRKTRTLPTRIRRALQARDGRCRFPGCARTRYLEGHHVKHWADGGETKISNLLQLCWYHHRAVHEGRFTIERADDGALVVRTPRGVELASVAPLPALASDPVETLYDAHREAGLAIGPRDALPTWMGESMDYGFAVWTLLDLAKRRRDAGGRNAPEGLH